MRTIAVGAIAFALVATACGAPASEDGSPDLGAEPTVTMSPVTTSPVTTSPVTTSPVTASPATTSTTLPPTESAAPSGEQEDESASEGQQPTVTTQPPEENRVKPILPIEPVEPHPSGPVAAAIADLATRLGVDESNVTLVSQDEVTWPDGSLGCPQPDMSYTQALVNGSLIVLEVDGKSYEYHSGGSREPFYCPNPTEPASGDYGDV